MIVTKLTGYMRFPLNVLAPIKFMKDAKHEGSPGRPCRPMRWSAGGSDVDEAPPGAPPPVGARGRRAPIPPRSSTRAGRPGLSKGAMLVALQHLVQHRVQVAPCITVFERGKDGVMCILPFFHSFGMVAMNFGMSQAGKLVLLPRFELQMALKAIQKEQPSFFPGVPRLFVALNEAPDTRSTT